MSNWKVNVHGFPYENDACLTLGWIFIGYSKEKRDIEHAKCNLMFHVVSPLVYHMFSHVVLHVELLLKPYGFDWPYIHKFALVLRERMRHAVTAVFGGHLFLLSPELLSCSFFWFFSFFFFVGKKCTRSWLSSLLFAPLSFLSSLLAYELHMHLCACMFKTYHTCRR